MELKCEFRSIEGYTCVVNKTSITEPTTEIKEIYGEHEPGKSHKDVESIIFLSAKVHYFPRGLSKIFPALKSLIIYKCGLKSITRDDLNGLEKLEILALRSNQLRQLPSNLLVGMTKLKRILFDNNNLERISSKLLEPIANNALDLVYFQANTKIDAYFGPEYGGVKSLLELMEIIDKSCDEPDDNLLNKIH
jgi:Leucine-rich repeat (LRR) protein